MYVKNNSFHLGFSLFELLVVIVIVGVLVSTVSLAFIGDASQQLRSESFRFAKTVELMREYALYDDKSFGLFLEPNAYRVVEYNDNASLWQQTNVRLFNTHTVHGAIGIDFSELNTASQDAAPHLVVHSTGEITPFSVEFFVLDNPDSRWVADSDGLSKVSVRSANAIGEYDERG